LVSWPDRRDGKKLYYPAEGISRWKNTRFLETCDRFHGAWPHWLDGNTGNTIPFGTKDDGGDLVETAFMLEGLLTIRQYLDSTCWQKKPDRKNQCTVQRC